VAVGEVIAGCDELPFVGGTALVIEPALGRVDLQERVLDESPLRHLVWMIGADHRAGRSGGALRELLRRTPPISH
jgi:hypothetical protein